MMSTRIDEAHSHMVMAYEILRNEGYSEKFFPLAVDVGQQHWGRFFGEFGTPYGLAIEITKSDIPNEIILSVVISRNNKSFWSRFIEAVTESWAILRNKETRYTIHLADDQLTKFKDLLRNLQ